MREKLSKISLHRPRPAKLIKGFLLLTAIVSIIYFLFLPNYTKIKKLQERNKELESNIIVLAEDIEILKDDLENFKNDPFYLEKIAREQLGIARDNEVIVSVED